MTETHDLNGLKYCRRGNHYLPRQAFAKNRCEKDGLQTRCRACIASTLQRQRIELKNELEGHDYYSAHPNETRLCAGCGQIKTVLEFYLKTNGLPRSQCKVCVKDRNEKSRKLVYKAYLARTQATRRADRLKHRYGISVDEYNSRLEAQGDKCAICKGDSPGGRWGTFFIVDHCHGSGEIRGLLCAKCNRMLGVAGDDLSGVKNMAKLYAEGVSYLLSFAEKLASKRGKK